MAADKQPEPDTGALIRGLVQAMVDQLVAAMRCSATVKSGDRAAEEAAEREKDDRKDRFSSASKPLDGAIPKAVQGHFEAFTLSHTLAYQILDGRALSEKTDTPFHAGLARLADQLRDLAVGVWVPEGADMPQFVDGSDAALSTLEKTKDPYQLAARVWVWEWLAAAREGRVPPGAVVPVAFAAEESNMGALGCFRLRRLPLTGPAIVEGPWSWHHAKDKKMCDAVATAFDAGKAHASRLAKLPLAATAYSWTLADVVGIPEGGAPRRMSFAPLEDRSLGGAVAALVSIDLRGGRPRNDTVASVTCASSGELGGVGGLAKKLLAILPVLQGGVVLDGEEVTVSKLLVVQSDAPRGGGVEPLLKNDLDTLVAVLLHEQDHVRAYREHIAGLAASVEGLPPYMNGRSRAELFVEPGFTKLRFEPEPKKRRMKEEDAEHKSDKPDADGTQEDREETLRRRLGNVDYLSDFFPEEKGAPKLAWKDVLAHWQKPGVRAIAVAPSGYGKSLLMLMAARDEFKDAGAPRTPVLVKLSLLAKAKTFEDIARAAVRQPVVPGLGTFAGEEKKEDPEAERALVQELEAGRCTVFLDGLDEVQDQQAVAGVFALLRGTENAVVVLTRGYGLDKWIVDQLGGTGGQLLITRVDPLEPEQTKAFVANYFSGRDGRDAEPSERLQQLLLRGGSLAEAARSGLLLTFVCKISWAAENWDGTGRQPLELNEDTTLTQLYEEIVRTILRHPQRGKPLSDDEIGSATLALTDAVFDAFSLDPSRNSVSLEEMLQGVVPEGVASRRAEKARTDFQRVLAEVREAGLLYAIERDADGNPTRYAFPHRSFLETLAALRMLEWVEQELDAGRPDWIAREIPLVPDWAERGAGGKPVADRMLPRKPYAFRDFLNLASIFPAWEECLKRFGETLDQRGDDERETRAKMPNLAITWERAKLPYSNLLLAMIDTNTAARLKAFATAETANVFAWMDGEWVLEGVTSGNREELWRYSDTDWFALQLAHVPLRSPERFGSLLDALLIAFTISGYEARPFILGVIFDLAPAIASSRFPSSRLVEFLLIQIENASDFEARAIGEILCEITSRTEEGRDALRNLTRAILGLLKAQRWQTRAAAVSGLRGLGPAIGADSTLLTMVTRGLIECISNGDLLSTRDLVGTFELLAESISRDRSLSRETLRQVLKYLQVGRRAIVREKAAGVLGALAPAVARDRDLLNSAVVAAVEAAVAVPVAFPVARFRSGEEPYRAIPEIILSLGRLGAVVATQEILAALDKLMGRDDWFVRECAAEAVGELGAAASSEIVDELVKLLEDSEDRVRLSAARAVGKLGVAVPTPKIQAELVRLLREPDPRFVFIALDSARNIGAAATPEVLAALDRLLIDDDWRVRFRAAEAVGELGATVRPEVVDELAESLGDQDFEARWDAVCAVEKLGAAQVTPKVLAAVHSLLLGADARLRRRAVGILARFDIPIPRLIEASQRGGGAGP